MKKCEKCGKSCVKRISVKHGKKIIMVGPECSKNFKKASAKDIVKSYKSEKVPISSENDIKPEFMPIFAIYNKEPLRKLKNYDQVLCKDAKDRWNGNYSDLTESNGYDTYKGFVVAARNKERAMEIASECGHNDIESWRFRAIKIANSSFFKEEGMILHSFSAG